MTGSLDRKLGKYIDKLYAHGEKSVFGSIKRKRAASRKKKSINIEQYNKELEEAVSAIERGEFYTHEQVKEHMDKLFREYKSKK